MDSVVLVIDSHSSSPSAEPVIDGHRRQTVQELVISNESISSFNVGKFSLEDDPMIGLFRSVALM